MTATAHAYFSASKAPRWMRCPGSLSFDDAPVTSHAALEGKAAHELAAWCLETGLDASEWPHAGIAIDDTDIAVGDEMVAAVATYVRMCRKHAAGALGFGVEQRVDYSDAIGQPDSFGTADFLAINGSELVVADFKYGDETPIKAEDNEQLQLYALGALNLYGLVHAIDRIRLIISQPRLRHKSEWCTTPGALRQFAEIARARAHQALQPDAATAFLNPGETQCRYCPARTSCPALVNDVLATVAGDFDLAALLPKLDMIEDWCDAVRERARRTILEGGTIAGFKLVPGRRSVRAWSSASEAEAVLRSMRLRQEEMYDLSLISPPAAERLLKDSPKRWARLVPLISQREGLPVVVRDDALSVDKPAVVAEPAEAAWI